MIEQQVEKKLVDRFADILQEYNIQIVGTLQPGTIIKGEEETGYNGVLAIKVAPREYETPTTPDCKLNCGISLSLRADLDYKGTDYLGITDLIISEMERLQKCLDDAHEDYSVDGFEVTGFLLSTGDTSIDQDNKIWGYSHQFTIYGIAS